MNQRFCPHTPDFPKPPNPRKETPKQKLLLKSPGYLLRGMWVRSWNQPTSTNLCLFRTQEMANIIASRAPLVVHLLKRQLLCMSPAPSLTPEVFEELHEKRKQTWCSNDMEEGVRAFFAKRPPCFRGNWGGMMTFNLFDGDLESAKWWVWTF